MAPWSDCEECKRDYSFCSQLSDMLSETDALQRRVNELEAVVRAAEVTYEAAKTLMAESDRHNQIFAWDAAGNPTSVAEEWGPLVEAMPCLCAALAALSRPEEEE